MAESRVKPGKKKRADLPEEKKSRGRLSPTLEHGLRSYAIGERLRGLRLKKKMGLVELGTHTGLSPALLSKLERGRLFPTLPTLLRIALVFSVDLQYFFAGPRELPVVAIARRKDRIRLPDAPAPAETNYFFESLDYPASERRLNAYYAEFPPAAEDRRRVHAHQGAEVVYVLRGALQIRIGEDDHILEAGDSIYFDCGVPHAYRNHGRATCAAIVVTTT